MARLSEQHRCTILLPVLINDRSLNRERPNPLPLLIHVCSFDQGGFAVVRPLSCDELHREDREVLYSSSPGTLQVNHGSHDKLFTFDAVFKPKCSQHEVFEKCGVKRLLDLVFQGFSCTVFAFGQTGSGKTYTLCGPYSLFHGGLKDHSFCGLTQRSFEYLLERTQSTQEEFMLSATFLEIYNEQVRDLLNPSGSLNVRWNKEKGFYVQNLTRVNFELLGTVMDLLERDNALGSLGKEGKFCIVDLAGNERVKETGSFGELLEEACSINRSLLTLGNCISALVDTRKKERHIPYRDSKLTKLLADSLGGSGLTLMIACVSPAAECLQETLNVLRYANRAKTIKNRPMAKLVVNAMSFSKKLVLKYLAVYSFRTLLYKRKIQTSTFLNNSPYISEILGTPNKIFLKRLTENN
ncbi:KIF12 protein, partial [Polypterus senegalus]